MWNNQILAPESQLMLERADELARQLYSIKKYHEAAAVSEAVILLSGRSHGALLNAARCYLSAGDPVRCEALLSEAHEHAARPLGNHEDREMMVLALGWQGRHNEAEQVLHGLPENPQRQYNLGWHSMRRGHFKDALPLLESGRPIGIWGDNDFRLPTPQWDGVSDLAGKTVLLNLERGLGDHIIQARHARDLAARGANVIVRTHPSLVMTLGHADGASSAVAAGMEIPEHDLWIPGMSASFLLGVEKPDGAPYLKPVPWAKMHWEERLGEHVRPRIGIRWQGNPAFEHEQMRTVPAAELAEALRGLGDLYSFQRDVGAELCPEGVTDLSEELVSWEDTVAALSFMDVIVTSCTSITHAAAAQGVPTVVLTPVVSYYPWSDETVLPRSDWYDSVLVAKQTQVGKWSDAIERAAGYAQEFLDAKDTKEKNDQRE